MKAHESRPKDARAWYRNNSSDALYGALTAVEAALSVVLANLAHSTSPAEAQTKLLSLRAEVEAAADREAATTRFGTGAEEILDGRQDALDTVFGEAMRLTRGEP